MPIHGFTDRTTAERLKRFAMQHQSRLLRTPEPEQGPHRPKHNHFHGSGWWVKVPAGGIPAMVGEVPGKAVCDIYHIDPDEEREVWRDRDTDVVTETVYNVSDAPITSDYALCVSIYNRPVAIPEESCGTTEVLADLDACLLRSDGSGTATRRDNGVSVTFQNDFELDGLVGSLVKLQMFDGVWYLMHVANYKARWLRLTTQSGAFVLSDWHNGDDPRPCGMNIICDDFDCACLLSVDGNIAYARYSTETDKYYIDASGSSVLGPPADIPLVTGSTSPGADDGIWVDGCDLKYTQQTLKGWACGNPVSIKTDSFMTQVTVLTGAELTEDNKLCFDTAQIYACAPTVGADVCIDGTDCNQSSSSSSGG